MSERGYRVRRLDVGERWSEAELVEAVTPELAALDRKMRIAAELGGGLGLHAETFAVTTEPVYWTDAEGEAEEMEALRAMVAAGLAWFVSVGGREDVVWMVTMGEVGR